MFSPLIQGHPSAPAWIAHVAQRGTRRRRADASASEQPADGARPVRPAKTLAADGDSVAPSDARMSPATWAGRATYPRSLATPAPEPRAQAKNASTADDSDQGLRMYVPGLKQADVDAAHDALLRALDHALVRNALPWACSSPRFFRCRRASIRRRISLYATWNDSWIGETGGEKETPESPAAVGCKRLTTDGGFRAGCLHQDGGLSLNECVPCRPGHVQTPSAPGQPTNSRNACQARYPSPPHRVACHA
jgi:hypothetical protein